VPPDGPLDAEVLAIGEAPGYEEDKGGVPFIGRAGREFNDHYLGLAGLSRDEIYLTNTVQCRPDLNRKPNNKEIWGCARNHIPKELELVRPKVVILMGGTACTLLEEFGGKPDLDADHGIPQWRKLFGWEGWVVPMYHPAAGMHNTSLMQPLIEDWTKLRWWLEDGKWMWAKDSWAGRKRDYRLLDSNVDVDRYFERYTDTMQFAVYGWMGGDTESHAGVPYSIQVSLAEGSGALALRKNAGVVEYLAEAIQQAKVEELILHNAPADLDDFYGVEGLALEGIPYRDTMQEAYGLTIWPQALKVISKRILGRNRKSWEETVIPPSKRELGKWMRKCLLHAEENWREVIPRFHKKTKKPLKPQVNVSESEKLLPALYGFMVNNPDYKIWDKLLERMPGEELKKLVHLFGPWPTKGVAHLTIEELLEYGCSDADDALTFAVEAERLRGEFIRKLDFQEEDRDR
jgi:DNA polymerase